MLVQPPDVHIPDFLYGNEAAAYLRVDGSTIYRWIKEGRLPAVKVAGRWRVARQYLDAILAGEL